MTFGRWNNTQYVRPKCHIALTLCNLSFRSSPAGGRDVILQSEIWFPIIVLALSLSLSISGAERWIVLAILCPSRSVLSWIWSLNVLKRISHHRSVLHTDTDTATRFKQVYICKTTKGRRGAGSLAHCGRQTVTWSVLLTSLTERIRKYKLKTGNTLRPAALLDTLIRYICSQRH